MNNEKFSYKSYTGSIEVSVEDSCLHGEILFIDDIITYEGDRVEELQTSFKEAVERYVSYCKETGKPANKPYSGTFNVRIGEELHREAAKQACLEGKKLNEFVTQCIQKNLLQDEDAAIKHEHHHVHEVIYTGDTDQNVISGLVGEVWDESVKSEIDINYYVDNKSITQPAPENPFAPIRSQDFN